MILVKSLSFLQYYEIYFCIRLEESLMLKKLEKKAALEALRVAKEERS